MAVMPSAASELTPYLPRVVIRELAHEPASPVRELPGTLVFADVAGFTQLSERLARIGARGRRAAQRRDRRVVRRAARGRLRERRRPAEVRRRRAAAVLRGRRPRRARLPRRDRHAPRAARRRRARRAGRPRRAAHVGRRPHRHLHLFLAGRLAPRARRRRPGGVGGAAHGAAPRAPARSSSARRSPSCCRPRALGAAGRRRAAAAAPRPPGATARPRSRPSRPTPARLALGLPAAVREHVLGGGRAPEHRLVTVAFVRFGGTDARIARERPGRRRGRRSTSSSATCRRRRTRTSVVAPRLRRRRRRRQARALRGRAARRRRRGGADAARAARRSPTRGRRLPVQIGVHRGPRVHRRHRPGRTGAPTRRWATSSTSRRG